LGRRGIQAICCFAHERKPPCRCFPSPKGGEEASKSEKLPKKKKRLVFVAAAVRPRGDEDRQVRPSNLTL